MTIELKNKNGETIPPRPSIFNSDLHQAAIERAVDEMFNAEYCPFQRDKKQKLIESLNDHWHPYIDEYDLAKRFEQDGWGVDGQFVEKLADVNGYIDGVFRELEAEWFDTHQPVPPFPIGTKLDVGLITGIEQTSKSKYLVLMNSDTADSTTRGLIYFENAVEASNEH